MHSIKSHESVEDLRALNIFKEAEIYRSRSDQTGLDSVCQTILIAADVLRRTILAVHDSQQSSREYNP